MPTYDPPTQSVLDVSAYIFRRLRKLGNVEALKLQKLLYYCNAWSLVDRNQPLFVDEIQAWKHGPVVASIYPLHRGEIELAEWPYGAPDDLDGDQQLLIDSVIDTYGGLSGWRLRNLTHQERPWIDAWKVANEGQIMHVPIDGEITKDFYRSMRGSA